MAEQKTVKINLVGVVNLPIDELNEFQEDIKVLPEENYQRMKAEILADGFSFSPHVFMDGDSKAWILDGHQRKTTLTRMRSEGYEIPTIPCMEVEAESLEHARQLVLAAASQFGVFKIQKLLAFTKKTALEPKAIISRFILPAVKIERLVDVQAHSRDVGEGATEVDLGDEEFAHSCPKCGFGFNDK